MTDFDLLQEYASRGSDAAFGTLVKRYANLVYSAALRQTGDWHTAEDVAQAVFITLARKAGGLRPTVVLSGWLLRTTRFVSLNVRRRESRRRQLEEQAGPEVIGDFAAAWNQIALVIDEALAGLAQRDRDALALRFFEQKSFREIGQAIGTSEDGAHKRVLRALDKLRADFLKKGIALSATVLVGAISTKSVQAAPVHLAGRVLEAALTQGGGKGSVLADEAAKTLRRQRVRPLLTSVAALSLVILLVIIAGRFPPRRASLPEPLNPGPVLARTAAPAAANPALPVNGRQLLVRVADARTRQPIRNARLTQVWDRGYGLVETNFLTTDRAGEAWISFDSAAKDLWNLRIDILSDAHIPKFVSWAAARGDLLQDIPAQYDTQLEAGSSIGGVVVDEDGKSVPGVRVLVSGLPENTVTQTPAAREGEAFQHDETTDLQGRWLCNHAPTQLQKLSFTVSHPDFIRATFRSSTLGVSPDVNGSRLTESDFRRQLAVMVLKAGRVANGRVIDGQGMALSGAVVTVIQSWEQSPQQQTTGVDGQFRIAGLDTNRAIITVEQSGYRMVKKTLAADDKVQDLEFSLEKGLDLRLRISDDTERNLAGASVNLVGDGTANWHSDWSSMSDVDGKVQWASAPERGQYRIWARGYQPATLEIDADGTEHHVVLHALTNHEPFRVSGVVIDLQSRMPIEQFEVWAAVTLLEKFDSGRPNRVGLAPELKTTGTHGRFAFLAVNSYSVVAHDVEIKAEGYFPSRQTVAGPLTNECRLAFELSPLRVIEGTVESSNGEPVSGAVVMFSTGNDPAAREPGSWTGAYMSTPGQLDLKLSGASQAETDSHGHFKLRATAARGMLIAAHKTGFAASTLAQIDTLANVRLQPWGSLEGILKVGAQPGSHKTISIHKLGTFGVPLWFQAHLSASTDEEGHFSLNGIPPGEWDVLPHNLKVQIEAGATNQIVLGGTGRKVFGRLVNGTPGVSFKERGYRLSLSTQSFAEAKPLRSQFRNIDEYVHAKSGWILRRMTFQRSEEGRAAARYSRSYAPEIQPDGRFVIDEVLPGDYALSLSGDPLKLDPYQMDALETFDKEIRVFAIEGSDASAVDLGNLEVQFGGK